MGLRQRIAALEHDITQANRDRRLEPGWEAELARLRHVSHAVPLPRMGVDYSFGRPTPKALRAEGATFACRYLTGAGKALERDEARGLSLAGLDIVACFEGGAENMLGGAEQGRKDADFAVKAALALAMPSRRPIYFACDFDADGPEVFRALDYLGGARAVLDQHGYEVGIYGGLLVVKAALDEGLAWAWQTLAWSGTPTEWELRAQLRQTAVSGPVVYGVPCDTDYAYSADFGQWRLPS